MPMPDSRFSVVNPMQQEWFDQPLYDRCNYPILGSTSLSFFAVPKGQAAVLTSAIGGIPVAGTNITKTYRDTNIITPNFMPQYDYMFTSMSVAVFSVLHLVTDMVDREIIRDNGVFHFRVNAKDILYVPFVYVPEVNPIAFSTMTAIYGTSNGMVAPGYTFKTPIYVPKGNSMEVTLEYPGLCAITSAVDIGICLFGVKQQPT